MNDFSLEVAVLGGPAALIYGELTEAVLAGVFVGFGDDVGGCVGDSEVEDLSLLNHGVKRLHEFGDGAGEIPPVDIKLLPVSFYVL